VIKPRTTCNSHLKKLYEKEEGLKEYMGNFDIKEAGLLEI